MRSAGFFCLSYFNQSEWLFGEAKPSDFRLDARVKACLSNAPEINSNFRAFSGNSKPKPLNDLYAGAVAGFCSSVDTRL
jgi:hypothetical protein